MRRAARIFVADSENQGIQIFGAKPHAYRATLGVAGNAGDDDSHSNQPSNAHIDPAAQRLYIAYTATSVRQLLKRESGLG